MVSIQGSVSKAWLNREAGFTFPEAYYMDPVFRHRQDQVIHDFLAERFPRHAIYHMESNLVQAEYCDRRQLLVGGLQPNLILAAMLGGELIFPANGDADIKGRPLESINDIGELPDPGDAVTTPVIRNLVEQVKFLTRQHHDLRVIPPFFWDGSGRATIHGVFTTALKLRGESLLTDMLIKPEFVLQLLRWVTGVYISLVSLFSELTDMKPAILHIGECSAVMLSAAQFERFVLPYSRQLGQTLGPIRFHSCGCSTYLLSSIKKIQRLEIIDCGSDTSIDEIRKQLGQSVEVNISPPLELLLSGRKSGDVTEWLEKTLLENGAGPIKISYHLDPGYSLANCLLLHDYLRAEGLIKSERLF